MNFRNLITFDEDILLCGFYSVRCKGDQVSLLPIDHGRAYPLTFNFRNKNIVNGEVNFYSQPLVRNFDPLKNVEKSRADLVTGDSTTDELVIFNTLDNCYGHSLLKLFQAAHEAGETGCNSLLIVPGGLVHFVKKGTFTHLLSIEYNFQEFENCSVINPLITSLSSLYKRVFLFPVHTYATISRSDAISGLDLLKHDPVVRGKRIIFYYRGDFFRKWAGNRQKKRIIELFSFLRDFFSPEFEFVVLGDHDDKVFPSWIIDKRVKRHNPENDFEYNRLFAGSLLVVSMTGSHMLIPSLLSSCTAHLHSTSKYKNMAEDIVGMENMNSILGSYRHLYYYGNHNCSDLKSDRLGTLLLFHLQGFMEKCYKILDDSQMSQREFMSQRFPFFREDKARSFRTEFLRREHKKIVLGMYLRRIASPFN
jgi:hypothetical protein